MNKYEIFLLVLAALVSIQALLFWGYLAVTVVRNWFYNRELKRILAPHNANLRA